MTLLLAVPVTCAIAVLSAGSPPALVDTRTVAADSPEDPPYPTVLPIPPPWRDDASAIEAVIRRSFKVTAVAAETFAVTDLASVFTSDSAVKLGHRKVEFSTRALAIDAATAASRGELDYQSGFFRTLQVDAAGVKQLQARTRTEHGAMTSAERMADAEAVLARYRSTDPTGPRYGMVLSLRSIVVGGDRAGAMFHIGSVLARADLVRTPGGWRIAGERGVSVGHG